MTRPPELLPFNDVRALLEQLPARDEHAAARCLANHPTGPGIVARTASWLAGWTGRETPVIRRPVVTVFAASHEVAMKQTGRNGADGIVAMVGAIQAKQAPVAIACAALGLGLKVFELAPELPVADLTRGAALEERDCAATIAYGMEATGEGCDLLAVRAVAAGDEVSVSALAAALLGRGDECPATTLEALQVHCAHLSSPLEVLRRVGGRETAAAVGAILAARLQRVPVILDGAAAVAAAVVLEKLMPGAAAHCAVAARDDHADFARLCASSGCPVVLDAIHEGNDGTAAAFATAHVMQVLKVLEASSVQSGTSSGGPVSSR